MIADAADQLPDLDDPAFARLFDRFADRRVLLDAAQNARLIASAERYYRIRYYGGAESWNLRDTHMFETLTHLLDARGPTQRRSCGRMTRISGTRATPTWASRGTS